MKTVEIEADLADELAYGNCDDSDGWKHVQMDRGDEHRWYFDMTTVITQDNETFYAFDWVDDKTEMGDISRLKYTKGATPGTITAREVKPVTKVIVEYIPVP